MNEYKSSALANCITLAAKLDRSIDLNYLDSDECSEQELRDLQDILIVDYNRLLHVHEAVAVLLNARDFCADEKATLEEWEDENGDLTIRERSRVWSLVNDEWKLWQVQAGVTNILSTDERREAFNNLK